MTFIAALKCLAKPLLIGFIIALSLFNIYSIHLTKMKQTRAQEVLKHQEVNFWNEVIKQNGHFRDAYLALAGYYQKLGRNEIAKIYLKKAHAIDPNSEKVKGAYLESSSF